MTYGLIFLVHASLMVHRYRFFYSQFLSCFVMQMGLVPLPPLRITSSDIIGTFAKVTVAERKQLRLGRASEELVTFSI